MSRDETRDGCSGSRICRLYVSVLVLSTAGYIPSDDVSFSFTAASHSTNSLASSEFAHRPVFFFFFSFFLQTAAREKATVHHTGNCSGRNPIRSPNRVGAKYKDVCLFIATHRKRERDRLTTWTCFSNTFRVHIVSVAVAFYCTRR